MESRKREALPSIPATETALRPLTASPGRATLTLRKREELAAIRATLAERELELRNQ